MSEDTYMRGSCSFREYLGGSIDLFDYLPPAPTETIETIEDGVTFTVNGDMYTVLPKNRKSLRVVCHTGEAPTGKLGDLPEQQSSEPYNGEPSPTDRELIRQADQLVREADRSTYSQELWERLEKLNAPRQMVEIELPAGYSLTNQEIQRLQTLVQSVIEDNLKQSLRELTKIQGKIDRSKVVADHPKSVERED